MCTGRMDLSFPLRALLSGADGVLVSGCWPGECHYVTEGNYDALGNMRLLEKLLSRVGIDPKRLRTEWVGASQGVRFAEVVDSFTREVMALGPLGKAEGTDRAALMPRLQALSRLVPQFKLMIRERMQVRPKRLEGYDALYANPKVDEWIDDLMSDPAAASDDLPAYWIDPAACVGCLLCLKKCPVHAIEGASKTIHVIDQESCTHCGTCYWTCPPRIHAIRRMAAGTTIPAPIPAEQRALKSGASRA